MSGLTLRNVGKSYGAVRVIEGLNLDIRDGEFLVLVGPSGCGKSTLLRMIAGLEEITDGTVSIGDTIVNDLPASKRELSMVFQSYALYPHMSVRKNLAFGLQNLKMAKAELERRVADAARLLQIEPLLEEEITPVATPELAARYGGNAREILAHAPLIHVDRTQDGLEGTYPDWARYLREYGISRDDVTHGPRFNQASPSIEAARSGIGVILGRSILIERALERGELVPVAEPYPIRSPYYLLSPWKVGRDNVIERFKDWLFDKVSASSRLTAA